MFFSVSLGSTEISDKNSRNFHTSLFNLDKMTPTPQKSRTRFKQSLYRENFDFQNRGESSYERKIF